ncbi:MAG: AMP-binding protein [Verrucomicrobiota bacterium]
MDTALLTSDAFWNDPAPFAAGEIPDIPELAGHVLFETSGSSGKPKWVALSKQALLASAAAVNRHLAVTRESCWGLALPLHHVGGFGVAARAYEAGCGFQNFNPRWDARAFRDWLERNAITHTSLVPTQVHDLVRENLTAPATLRAIVVGGGHLDPLTGQAARDLGWPVLASYGMTEAGSQIATQRLDQLQAPYQSAPIPLLPVWDARITPENLLAISGPALFSGYLSGNDFPRRESEWHVTSDRAILENRWLTPLGRADALVKILGELVDPETIERELLSISQGQLTPDSFAVIAIPDERAGHGLVPVFESSVSPSVVVAVLSLYQAQAPGFQRLGPAVVIEKFPRSELGKLRRTALEAIYQREFPGRGTSPA